MQVKVSEMIKELECVKATIGDIPVQLQDDGRTESGLIIGYSSVFLVPEDYPDEGWILNIRWWPY